MCAVVFVVDGWRIWALVRVWRSEGYGLLRGLVWCLGRGLRSYRCGQRQDKMDRRVSWGFSKFRGCR